MLLQRLPVTIELAALSVRLSIVIAVPLGIVSALFRNRSIDFAARLFGLFGLSAAGARDHRVRARPRMTPAVGVGDAAPENPPPERPPASPAKSWIARWALVLVASDQSPIGTGLQSD